MRNMILLTATVLLLGQCGTKEIPQAGMQMPDLEIQLSLNQTVPLMGKDKTEVGEITFADLQDSRCPASAMCIRQGAAVTTFRVTTPINGETQLVRLFIGDYMPNDPRNKRNLTADTVTISAGSNTPYQLILKQVTPYPGTGTEDAQATIMLKQN